MSEPHADTAPAHEHTARPYLLVWLALLAFTALTVWTGKMHLGTWALPLAMGIAVTKSLLVMLFFMHLYDQPGPNRIVAGVSFVFVALLVGMTLTDVGTRFKAATPAGAPYGARTLLPRLTADPGAPEHAGPGPRASGASAAPRP